MKRTLIVCIVLLVLSSFTFADTIGENYEGGGIVIGGSGYVYSSLEGYWAVYIGPYVDFLLSDGLVVGLGLSVYRNSNETFEFGWSPFIGYTFGYDPKASTGPAHRLHISTGGTYANDRFGGTSIEGSLTPFYTFYYFLAPRIAPYIQLSAVSLYFGNGVDVSTYLNASFGISFHLPNRDRITDAIQ